MESCDVNNYNPMRLTFLKFVADFFERISKPKLGFFGGGKTIGRRRDWDAMYTKPIRYSIFGESPPGILNFYEIKKYYEDKKIKGTEIIAFIDELLKKIDVYASSIWGQSTDETIPVIDELKVYLETVFGDGPDSLRSAFAGTEYRAGKIVEKFNKCMIPLTRGGARKTSKRGRKQSSKRRNRQSRHRQSR
jgi:hypothetical protein